MDKVTKDGKVAILYSPGYGAGWSTWSDDKRLLYCPPIVHYLLECEEGKSTKDEGRIAALWGEYAPDSECYLGGARGLTVAWVDEGVEFRIDEYDGFESIEYSSAAQWETA